MRKTSWVLLGVVCAAPAAAASELQLGEVKVRVDGVVGAGTALRTRSPDPTLVAGSNGAASGVGAIATAGRNIDDGNLNYRRGDQVSTVLKGVLNLHAQYGAFGVRFSGMAWRDFALADNAVPWGHLPNNYAPNTPLADVSSGAEGRFSGAALLDAHLYGTIDIGGRPLHGRIGWQRLPWGVATTISTGLNVLAPLNAPASRRPGALPEETAIPIPALFARYGLTEQLDVEAFYQLAFQRTEPVACGSFYSTVDYLADGCDKIMLGGNLFTDRGSLVAGNYSSRLPDRPPSDGGQFGFGLSYKLPEIATQFGAYFAQFHSRAGLVGAVKAGRPIPLIPGDPDGLNGKYFIQYPDDIRVFAVNALTRTRDLTLWAEVAHRPNQPVTLHGLDLSNAFLSATGPTVLRAEVDALPFGATYAAYDRLAVTDVVVGGRRTWPGIFGAKAFTALGEVGVKYVHDLPDPAMRRYGRADVFGNGPVGGVCSNTSALACTYDGYVSDMAWGVRSRAALTYGLRPDTDLIPSFTYGYDGGGWSYDGAFSEGRQFAVMALRLEHAQRYAAEVAYVPTWGGRYNISRDRDTITFSVSARF